MILIARILSLLILLPGCGTYGTTTTSMDASNPPQPQPQRPPVGASWQIQYTGPLNLGDAAVVNLDYDDTEADQVAAVKARGGYAICYMNAGAWEDWRPDTDAFPATVKGKDMDDWPGEKWLNIRDTGALMPILEARIDECASKGFDAIDPDNVDGWINDTGFDLNREDSVAFVKALAKAAHDRGLAMGLKNATEILPDVSAQVDFAVNEECAAYGECSDYSDFLASGKAVFNVEYEGDRAAICASRPAGMSTVIKDRELGPGGESCS